MLLDVFSSLDYSFSNFSILNSFSFSWFLAFLFLKMFFLGFFCLGNFGMFCNLFYFNGWMNSLNLDKLTFCLVVFLFCFFYYKNMLGLFPYIFGITSHFFLNLIIAFEVWLMMIMFGFLSNFFSFFGHLVPFGSPVVISFFLCILESISVIMRFLTLSLRLAVKISTGHVFLSLLGGGCVSLFSCFVIFFFLCFYMIFECFVCFLQAFVFGLLVVQYLAEVVKTH